MIFFQPLLFINSQCTGTVGDTMSYRQLVGMIRRLETGEHKLTPNERRALDNALSGTSCQMNTLNMGGGIVRAVELLLDLAERSRSEPKIKLSFNPDHLDSAYSKLLAAHEKSK
ncbi:hypothetical protein HY572_00830 [Candidatus Micrarchaeota archaeon]|nr:hypothetical protein [Candidatus Micrarchaeota archaeon]